MGGLGGFVLPPNCASVLAWLWPNGAGLDRIGMGHQRTLFSTGTSLTGKSLNERSSASPLA